MARTVPALRFAAVGLAHGHIFDHINGLCGVGAAFVGYCVDGGLPGLIDAVAKGHPEARAMTLEAILGDPTIDVVCIAAVPAERAGLAIAAMRAGKDTMVDKPGVTSAAQLAAVRVAVAETGRIFSVCFSERLCVRSAVAAGRLVAAGAIGRVVQTLGLGPHRKGQGRPDWFWRMDRVGGIITDIASHQIDQFLFYTGSTSAEVVASSVGNFGTPEHPGFEDFGELTLRSPQGCGYVRVDWFTPDGLPTWGDGRLTILGTEGYIELRKYIDIAGRPGGNHLFLCDQRGMHYHDCQDEPLDYFDAFVADVHDRSETAMTQAHVLEVCRLALAAQQQAVRLGALA